MCTYVMMVYLLQSFFLLKYYHAYFKIGPTRVGDDRQTTAEMFIAGRIEEISHLAAELA